MMPLNHILRGFAGGYKLTKSQEKISHQMYIGDIKQSAKNGWKQAVIIYNLDIGMELRKENAPC